LAIQLQVYNKLGVQIQKSKFFKSRQKDAVFVEALLEAGRLLPTIGLV